MDTEIIAESRDATEGEKRLPTRREERAQERRLQIAMYVGIGLFVVVIGLVALALVVEPAKSGTDVAVLAPADSVRPSLPVAEEVVAAPAVAEVVESESPGESAAEAIPEVAMPDALVRLVNERMTAPDRDRFNADWQAMSRADRIEYLRQLGYDVSGL